MRLLVFVALCGCLAAGILLGSLAAGVTSGSGAGHAVTVPRPRLGDAVVYAEFLHNASQSHRADAPNWEPVGSKEWVVEGRAAAIDRNGLARDVVTVMERVVSVDWSYTLRHQVDVGNGAAVQIQDVYSFNRGAWAHVDTYFQPAGAAALFPYHGRTVQVDDPVEWFQSRCVDVYVARVYLSTNAQVVGGIGPAYRDARTNLGTDDCDDTHGVLYGSSVTRVEANAVRAGIVDGRHAIALRQTVSFQTGHDAWAFTAELPPNVAGTWLHDEWVSDELAFPVLVTDEVWLEHPDGRRLAYAAQSVLMRHQAGNETIAWGEGRDEPSRPLAKSPAQSPYPEDGQGIQLPYPLSAAVRDAHAASAPLGFTLWRAANPDAPLVSALFTVGDRSSPASATHQWHLVYAQPTGEGYEVRVERGAAGKPVFTLDGKRSTPPFHLHRLPQGHVTIAASLEEWQRQRSAGFEDAVPNYFRWGVNLPYTPGAPCFGELHGETPYEDPTRQLHLVLVGHSTSGTCLNTPTRFRSSILALDSTSTQRWFITESDGEFEAGASPVLATAPPPPQAPPITWAREDLRIGAVASASLFALFLVAYFAPALKAAGSQAFLLPGYARLRKDEVLDNKLRDQVMDAIREDPGLSLSDLRKKVGAGWGTIVHHVRTLQRHGLVTTRTRGRHRRVFPLGVLDGGTISQLALLKNERARLLYEVIFDEPGVIQHDLAQRLGVSSPAAYWYLKQLADVGLVRKVRDGRNVRYFPHRPLSAAQTPEGMEVA